jgi:molybdopterin/thiamine biosynthesis adenylyltransferase
MDERPLPFAIWHGQAVAALQEYFQSRVPPGRHLSEVELTLYRTVSEVTGWRISVEVDGQEFELDVVVDTRYPFSLPRLFLVGSNRFLIWPHVEKSGKLCLLPEHSTFRISTDAEVMTYLLDDAKRFMHECLQGSNKIDFATEFLSYWEAEVIEKVMGFWTIIKPVGPTRKVAYWAGSTFVILAEDPARGEEWLRHFFGEPAGMTFNFHIGLLLWLPLPLYPEHYPKTNADLRELAQKSGGASLEVLTTVIKSGGDGFPVVFGFDTEQGPALAGLWSSPPKHSIPHHKSGNELTKGFRPGKAPPLLLANRYLTSGGLLERRKVQRCDRTWIHSRGGDGSAGRLSHKKILLVGCGALGSQISELLAQGGVGRLVLIDHDPLTWDNVGRHILGGTNYVGMSKAEALRKCLQQRFPELDVAALSLLWEDAYERDQRLFHDCDVIVSTIGEWPSEAALNLLIRRSVKFPPVVFGWSEAYGCAGHALAVLDIGGCLACGMDEVGQFRFSPITWEVPPELQRVPGCGGFYQQFGSIASTPINALIASTVIDVLQGSLLRSHHRCWIGQSEAVTKRRGRWNHAWISRHGELGLGERIFRLDWPIATTCFLCKG